MIPAMAPNHADRMMRATSAAAAAGLGCVIVAPGPDLVYLTGYHPPPLERLTALILRPGTSPVLLVPELERARAAAEGSGDVAETAGWADGEDPYEAVRSVTGRVGRVAVSDRLWAVHMLGLQRALPGASFVPASRVLSPLRAVKDRHEVDSLRRAGRGADRTFGLIAKERFEGRTETNVATALGNHLLSNGHESVGFTIVASGPNGASPHHAPGDRRIAPGDVVVLDFGGTVDGYGSDITRTVSVGEPTQEVKQVYEVVRAAQQAGFEAVGAGVPAQEVDRAARRVIDEGGYGAAFFHRTGHGIGLEEHEDPYLVEGNAEPLAPGNCFSIEPGVYLAGRFGVRIEDIVHLGPDGPERLNEAPRDLVVVA
jgi:Xaa-Pro aminopeptidase